MKVPGCVTTQALVPSHSSVPATIPSPQSCGPGVGVAVGVSVGVSVPVDVAVGVSVCVGVCVNVAAGGGGGAPGGCVAAAVGVGGRVALGVPATSRSATNESLHTFPESEIVPVTRSGVTNVPPS